MPGDHHELQGHYAAVRLTDRHSDVHRDDNERVDMLTGIRTDRDYDLGEHREMAARSALVALREELRRRITELGGRMPDEPERTMPDDQ